MKFIRKIRAEKKKIEKKMGHKLSPEKVEKVLESLHKSACRFVSKKDDCKARKHCAWSPKKRKCRHVPHREAVKDMSFLPKLFSE